MIQVYLIVSNTNTTKIQQKNYKYKCYEKKNTNKKRNRIQQTFTHPHWQSFTIEPLGGQDVFQVHQFSVQIQIQLKYISSHLVKRAGGKWGLPKIECQIICYKIKIRLPNDNFLLHLTCFESNGMNITF